MTNHCTNISKKMVKSLWLLLQFAFLCRGSAVDKNLPQAIVIQSNQTERSCSYKLSIKSSCSSIPYTTDKISLTFGDAYGNEVYAPRIDEPHSRTFERCSTYVFEIRGPRMDVICYLYLLRNGSDGWKPESIQIYGPDRPIKFYFDTFLPDGVWYGITSCFAVSSLSAFFNYALL